MKFSDSCLVHSKKQDCSICYEVIGSSFKKLKCCHFFCKKCIFNWLDTNPSCPCCRTLINFEEYFEVLNYSISSGNTIIVYNKRYYIDPDENNSLYDDILNSDFIFERIMYNDEWTLFKEYIMESGLFSQFLNCHEEDSITYLKMEDYLYFDLPPFYTYNGKKYLNSYTLTCY